MKEFTALNALGQLPQFSVDDDGGMTVGVEETADRFRGLGDAFPVPAKDQVLIPLFHRCSWRVLDIS